MKIRELLSGLYEDDQTGNTSSVPYLDQIAANTGNTVSGSGYLNRIAANTGNTVSQISPNQNVAPAANTGNTVSGAGYLNRIAANTGNTVSQLPPPTPNLSSW